MLGIKFLNSNPVALVCWYEIQICPWFVGEVKGLGFSGL